MSCWEIWLSLVRTHPHSSIRNDIAWLIESDHQTVSQRGVVFFRAQDGLDDNLQKELVQRLGELSGKPASSKLHIHPVVNAGREHGGKDDEISIISSVQSRKIFKGIFDPSQKKQSGKEGWHSDITFEPIPSDYAILRLTELPSTGGGKFSVLPRSCQRIVVLNRWIRYPVGIGIRTLRSHLDSIPKIPRNVDRDLCTAFVRRVGKEKWFQAIHWGSRFTRERWWWSEGRAPRYPNKSRHRMEISVRSRPPCAADQRPNSAGVKSLAGMVRALDCRESRSASSLSVAE